MEIIQQATLPTVLCCMCGISMAPNQANTCAACLQTQYDITEEINKQAVLLRCRGCLRFEKDTSGWSECALESKELLALCLRKIKGLKAKLQLIDANFIWTEPHSKRIKISLTVQREVTAGITLQQSCVVTFVLQNKMCENCHKVEAKNTWNTVVQVRQKVQHKRTFLYLEQLILKYKQYEKTVKIEAQHFGVDFFFAAKNEAAGFVDFLDTVVPLKTKTAKKLITSDASSNTCTFNNTICAEIIPICKDDFIILPKALAHKLGNISRFVVCLSVTNNVKFIDPFTLQICDVNTLNYFKYPFTSASNVTQVTEFVVLNITPINDQSLRQSNGSRFGSQDISQSNRKRSIKHVDGDIVFRSKKHSLVDVEIARASDFGVNDTRFFVKCHLGNILHVGDSVLGYDLSTLNLNLNVDAEPSVEKDLPEIVLVKKHYPKYRKRKVKRNWKVKKIIERNDDLKLNKMEVENDERDEELFMRDIEEDEELRKKVNLYKSSAHAANNKSEVNAESDEDNDIEDDAPVVAEDTLLNEFEQLDIKQ